jgi:hypothetical protein
MVLSLKVHHYNDVAFLNHFVDVVCGHGKHFRAMDASPMTLEIILFAYWGFVAYRIFSK